MRYYQKGDMEMAVRPVTMWVVVGDLDAIFLPPEDRKAHEEQLVLDLNLVRAALTYLRSAHASKGLRLGVVYNPASNDKVPKTAWLTRALYLVGHPTRAPRSDEKLIKHVDQMAARNFGVRLLTGALDAVNASEKYASLDSMLVSSIDGNALGKVIDTLDRENFIESHSKFSRNSLGLKPGQRAVVINGKILGPLDADEEFTTEDFRLAERMTLDAGARDLGEMLNTLVGSELGGPEVISELTWRIGSILRPRDEASDSGVADIVSFPSLNARINSVGYIVMGFSICFSCSPMM
ncbi:unnamed protein product [Echinostoma caproni]|uniref:Thioredoxin_15 domain-containing protein n=1 Tax=Echinostoma caproni TaxID=27848 RepID=A0A183B9A4_9TREM|nr:unnamed protein product [Echinostoma caproni]